MPSGESTVPRIGASVVNGYSATFGFAFEMRVSSDDLPAFGSPTSAASASSLSRSSIVALLPGHARSPRSAASGASATRSACCRGRPCRPSRRRRALPACARSAISCSSSSSTCVPTGTTSSTVLARRAVRQRSRPALAAARLEALLRAEARRDRAVAGPRRGRRRRRRRRHRRPARPSGTCFSRRK